jgi:ATP-dependent DNA helicase DinG
MDLHLGDALGERRLRPLLQGDGPGAGETRSWPSPFDFERQALLYVPEGLPDPNSEKYGEAVIDAAWPVVRASGGHAFLLFTSLRAMDRGFERLAARLRAEGLDWPLLLQGDGLEERAAGALSPLAQRDPGRLAVLLGRRGRAGEQLSVVVIDRCRSIRPTTRCWPRASSASTAAAATPSWTTRCRAR